MRPRAWPALALASAIGALAAAGCREGGGPAGAGTETEGEATSSSEAGLDGSSTGVDPEPLACTPGQTRACYEGPPSTEGLGRCAAGEQVCAADGSGFGECVGQQWPEPAERCDTAEDDDCDGSAVCEPTVEWGLPITGYATHVAALPDGGMVVVGSDGFGETLDVPLDGAFVLVLDAKGEPRWVRTGFGGVWPGGLAVDAAGDIVVMGFYQGAPNLGGGALPSGGGGFAVRYSADGEHVWTHGLESEGYFSAAFGEDGTTYLAGGYLYGGVDGGEGSVQVHVAALAADGSVAWILPGWGGWDSDPLSLFLTEAGELALVGRIGGSDVQLGELPIESSSFDESIVARIGLDGTPIDARPLLDPPATETFYVRAIARPGGALAAVQVLLGDGEPYLDGTMLVALDETLAPVSQHFLGDRTAVRSMAPYPDGSTVISADFIGILELGPIGVGIDGPALAVVDDQGQGRWAEVLHGGGGELQSVAALPDGGVLAVGYASRLGVLADVSLAGSFVVKLRP